MTASRDLVASLEILAEAEEALRALIPLITDRELRLEFAIEMCAPESGIQFAKDLLERIPRRRRSPSTPPGDDDRTELDRVPVPQDLDLASGPHQRSGTHTILGIVRQQPGHTRVELANFIGLSHGKVSSSLANLKRWGWVYDEDHKWHPTDKIGEPDLRNVRTKIDPRIWGFLCGERDEFQTRELAAHLNRAGSGLSSSLAALSSRGVILKINDYTWRIDKTRLGGDQ